MPSGRLRKVVSSKTLKLKNIVWRTFRQVTKVMRCKKIIVNVAVK